MQTSDRAIPILPSRSLPATLRFYQQLGFTGNIHATGNYLIMTRGSVEVHFFLHTELVPAESSAGCYLRVADVDEYHRAFQLAQLPHHGIPRLDRVEDKPWGMHEFALVDPDGNLVRVGQKLAG